MKINELLFKTKYIFSSKYFLAAALGVFSISSLFSGNVGFVYAIFLTLFLPGFVFVTLFLKDLEAIEKFVLTLFLSLLLSTQLVYWLSLLLGYSKVSIVLAGLLFAPAIFFIPLKKPDFLLLKHPALLAALGIFIVFYIILSGSIWVAGENEILLTGSNWQDTPMHLGIIESLNQGNFPPQMPYYSGVRMTYHYFVDFHTAIIEKMANTFNPRLLVFLNSLFASIFALAIYALANYITGSSRASIFAVIIGVFGGSFSYLRFFNAFLSNNWSSFSDLFQQNYVQEWKKFFQIVPVFDSLLQSRPQMIGLTGLALAAYFLYRGFIERDAKKMALAGLITGLLFPFHVTAFISLGLIFILLALYLLLRGKLWLRGALIFLIPVLLSLPFILAVDTAVRSHLSLDPGWWAPDKSPSGLILFYIGNLGIPFVLSLFFPIFQRRHVFFIYSWIVSMFLLPNIISFTPESFDMYTFFHFMWIPVAVASGILLERLYGKKFRIVVAIFIIFSVFTPFLDSAWNLSIKYPGYSLAEYNAGIWIRENTPQNSVFLEETGIHSPPSQIGGRLQIMGYGTWAYGHGYDIWTRDADIKKAFSGTKDETLKVAAKYNASYAYIGSEEQRTHSDVKEKFDRNFENVYSDEKGRIWIYKLNTF